MYDAQTNAPALWQPFLPQPHAQSHKYSRGYVLIQGGYPVTGAARLAAMAAARCGAGMTAIAAPAIALPIYASALLSVMVKPYANAAELQTLLEDTRVSSYLIGPGAGLSQDTRLTTLAMLTTGKPVVIDADALTTFAGQADTLKQAISASCVLTPHEGEFKSVFGVSAANDRPTRIPQAVKAAQVCGAIVLLKGAHTIIATPEGRVLINEQAPPTLATAGAGDVLAGMIASLLAQGMPAFEACAAATWIHAQAARLFGVGLIAEDLPGMIPAVLQALLKT
ncbi:NAD(P)H-hydrate dehydratase [Methylophilus sp. VKM B-3414]|uniref:NAD(P)H-hydrate dehydratase n=1 Tax=Methylophilus sp. VKM B-3414 TaxID=3076121 RepID=UPI0028C7D355|nr:NAD(P)H-hydrate dehydratase [Methylophilus sp. VKM B-3414]MDT7850138.1 NAD(P)H-hydrate dehydratase [Methylophilus sp. VKM B-3414]